MLKKSILLLAFGLSTGALRAQSVFDLFAAMPDSLAPLLTADARRTLGEWASLGLADAVRNRLGDEVRAVTDSVNDSFMQVELSAGSSLQLKVLHTTDSVPVVALIRTVYSPAGDSRVTFHDAQWRPLEWLQLPCPAPADFLAAAPDSLAEDARYAALSLADLPIVEVLASATSPTFLFTIDISQLAEKERDAAKFLAHPLQYVWTGKDFVSVQAPRRED